MEFLFCCLGHAQGVGLGHAGGGGGSHMFEQMDKKIFTILCSKVCLFRPTVNVLKF